MINLGLEQSMFTFEQQSTILLTMKIAALLEGGAAGTILKIEFPKLAANCA